MSCKVLTSSAAVRVDPIAWRTVSGPARQPVPVSPPAHDDASGAGVQELERVWQIRAQQAFQDGHAKGEAAGGQAAAQRLDPVVKRLAQTIDELAGLRRRCRADAEEDAVKLSLAIARRILHRELSVDPEAVVGLVRAAFDKLDARETHRVRLHPDDAELLRAHLGQFENAHKIEIVADPSLERASAIFDTSRGALDASVSAQLTEIERGFTDLVRRHRSL
ncbi:MAG: flagellar assembly protein FliH [Bryobacteraceae bacterium]